MDEDRKAVKAEAGASDSSVLNVRVKDQAGGEMVFKVKSHTRFQKILDTFCMKKAVDPAQVRFVFEGQRINTTSCPNEVGMEDGDTIDAFLEQ
ncbi:hypothetical protein H632_c818p0, partial [Helicosporidium sp. ATCC 50920]